MTSLIVALLSVITLSAPVFAEQVAPPKIKGLAFIISGGPFDLGASETDNYSGFIAQIQSVLSKDQIIGSRAHNSRQGEICNYLTEMKNRYPSVPLFLAGHSFGSDASVWVSHCLKSRGHAVDFLFTMDTVARNPFGMGFATKVPENVRANFNFFQQGDLLLWGIGSNRAIAPALTDIFNAQQFFGNGFVSSHMEVLKKMNQYHLPMTISQLLFVNQVEPRQIKDLMKPVLKSFFKDFPNILDRRSAN